MQVDPKNVIGAVVTPSHASHLCYRIEKVLQSAIYGAVFLAYEFPSAGQSRLSVNYPLCPLSSPFYAGSCWL